MAPEIFLNIPYEGQCVDLFAAGVILFVMKVGAPPFMRANHDDPRYKLFFS